MKEVEVYAYDIAAEIELGEFFFQENGVKKNFKWNDPYVIKHNALSYSFIYNFGAVVFLNVPEIERLGLMNKLTNFTVALRKKRTEENFKLIIDSKCAKVKVNFDNVVMPKLDIAYAKLLSFILAQSVSLKQFERQVDVVLDQLYYVIEMFWKRKKLRWNNKKILSLIAYAIKLRHSILSELLLLDKPASVWESKQLDKFYEALYDMFELEERFTALDRKLEILLENTQIITDLSVSRKEIFLEWMIVGLFIIDVMLFLFEILA